jgi:hypothetical protein
MILRQPYLEQHVANRCLILGVIFWIMIVLFLDSKFIANALLIFYALQVEVNRTRAKYVIKRITNLAEWVSEENQGGLVLDDFVTLEHIEQRITNDS